ncbi:MAG: hypothetical protein SFV15_20885 [Polyangiaceae bacterium]|nr:hypothetical protein [Polyangiaceae bacterium]
MLRSLKYVSLVGTLLAILGCSPGALPKSKAEPAPVSSADPSVERPRPSADPSKAAGSDTHETAVVSAAAPTVLLSSTKLLRELERQGFGFLEMLDPERALAGESAKPSTNQALAQRSQRYRDLVNVIREDIARARSKDPSSGVGLAFSHRLLDAKVLVSKEARWELIGVSQRLDRLYVKPEKCGEVRFIYRLAYATSAAGKNGTLPTDIASRLPATVAISYWNTDGTASAKPPSPKETTNACSLVAKRWMFDEKLATPSSLTAAGGPIHPASRGSLKAVEMNIQIVRWPSTVRGNMAGYAEYALHALVPVNEHLALGSLENTPEPERLVRKWPTWGKAKEGLASEHLRSKIERGTYLMEEGLLAKTAISVTPHGFGRLQNRPYFAQYKDASALVRKLDTLSCQGCHASRSIAGFHFLGDETAPEGSVNAILVGRSPHLLADLARRKGIVAKLAGMVTAPEASLEEALDIHVPFPDQGGAAGKKGEHCALTNDPVFVGWKCAEGLQCEPSPELGMGTCTPKELHAGDACEVGTMSFHVDPHRDRVINLAKKTCEGVCESNYVGFPSGACASNCGSLAADEVCGAIPFLVGFNGCLGKTTPFEDCIRQNARAAALQRCDETRPCRDDYICARTSAGEGACMPPYFLFQLRIDGHPSLGR